MTAIASRLSILTLIASICHEANRQYCKAFMSDDTQPEWKDAPAWQAESALKGVEGIADGRITKPSQSHESWLEEKRLDGWQYGAVKDPVKKLHPCFVPYDQLPELQRHKDALFFATATSMLYAFGLQAPAQASTMVAGESKPSRSYAVDEKTILDIDRRFTYHAPKPDQLPRYAQLRFEALGLAQVIAVLTPPSREQSLALTNLEQACFWANAAIARNE